MNIVFHHPRPLDPAARSASGIRPQRMLEAFKALGCTVEIVAGYSAERSRAIEEVKSKVRKGYRYDFVYSESSTMPTVMTDPHHFPVRPIMDWRFLALCRSNNIPVGLFYRDIYWLFKEYGKGLEQFKVIAARTAYRFDLWWYGRTLSRLYLPSREMIAYVPGVDTAIMDALPPGHTAPTTQAPARCPAKGGPIELFYVGGMSDLYRMHTLFQVVESIPEVRLTVCTREAEWESVKHGYPPLTSNIRVIHESGKRMAANLMACDIALLFLEPHKYREFASPVKLYEYLGYQKPVLAAEGTLVGNFVRDNHIGWTLPYDHGALEQLLYHLLDNPAAIGRMRNNVAAVAEQHTWEARARKVINDLSQ